MDRPRVDYDSLSGSYHSRYDSYRLDAIGHALYQLIGKYPAAKVLEVGCGTGRWIESLRASGVSVYGVDASSGMLSQARDRLGPAGLVVARANQLPLAGESFDTIFSVNAIHHFDDPGQFVGNAATLLRPGGTLATIGIDPRISRRRYFYDYFEGSLDTDLQRYPSFGQLVDWSAAAGLEDVELRVVERSSMEFKGREVFGDPFLKKDSNSLLALLTNEVYAAGLAKIESDAARAEGRSFRSELTFSMVSGVKAQ